MSWYRLTFQAGVIHDLSTVGQPMAQRLFEKTKWIASNVDNLRHESIPDLAGLHKYAVADWRIFYAIDRNERLVDVHAIIHKNSLTQ
jgi:mRNA interferase RelE/StbE